MAFMLILVNTSKLLMYYYVNYYNYFYLIINKKENKKMLITIFNGFIVAHAIFTLIISGLVYYWIYKLNLFNFEKNQKELRRIRPLIEKAKRVLRDCKGIHKKRIEQEQKDNNKNQ